MPEAAFSTAETDRHSIQLDPERFNTVLKEFKATPSTGLLGDLLSFSIDPEFRVKIIETVGKDPSTKAVGTPVQSNFIHELLEGESASPPPSQPDINNIEIYNPFIRREVATLRSILRADPANPLALLDLAQFQLAAGQTKRAEKSVVTALSLSPNNRVTLRTLARLYVHQRDFQKAHSLIYRHARTAFDPWLMATEIALAEVAEVPSRFATKGFKFTRDRTTSNAHLSELAGALGSSELNSGNMKRAREMFRLALLDPNDNVVAQAVTHQRALGIDLSAPAQRRAVMSAHEAQTLLAWNSLDSERAQVHAHIWHEEEPFSSRPLQFLTTLYAARGDHQSAAVLAKRGLIADPTDPALLANLAYVSACCGEMDQAQRALSKLLDLKQPKYNGIALATAGLMAMKDGQWAIGDKFYETSMQMFRDRKEYEFEALCCAYFARSAFDTGHPNRDTILQRAESLCKQHPTPDAAIVLRLLDVDISPTNETQQTRRLSQWIFDSRTQSLIQVHGVSAPGAPPLVIKN